MNELRHRPSISGLTFQRSILSERLRRDLWRPDKARLFMRKEWGWGWTVNFVRYFSFARRVGS